jgi:hypothetical protein
VLSTPEIRDKLEARGEIPHVALPAMHSQFHIGYFVCLRGVGEEV